MYRSGHTEPDSKSGSPILGTWVRIPPSPPKKGIISYHPNYTYSIISLGEVGYEIIFIAIGLAMDAFAVSICKGLAIKKIKIRNSIIVGTYFGMFQAIMPLIGYMLGNSFRNFVTNIDHWIIFLLLGIIGIKMIVDSFEENNEKSDSSIELKTMLLLALATSIDALAVGITFSFFKLNIFYVVSIIGIITFLLSAIGVKIGNKFGNKLQNKAEIFGGIILILIGIKILLEHLNILILI